MGCTNVEIQWGDFLVVQEMDVSRELIGRVHNLPGSDVGVVLDVVDVVSGVDSFFHSTGPIVCPFGAQQTPNPSDMTHTTGNMCSRD